MLFFKYLPGLYQGADHTGRRVMNLDFGGSSPPPAPTQVTQMTIPEYAKPYMEDVLGRTAALMEAPYQVYGGERFAGPSDLQAQARRETAGLQTPGQFEVGTGLIGSGGIQALRASQYDPSQFFAQMAPVGQVGAQTVAEGGIRAAQMMGPQTFDAAQAAQYMSPYMQQVVDIQKQKAIEDAQKTQLAQNLSSARQGTYGGARQTLAQLEREKALGGQLMDIQARGLQTAYESAQEQFERDRASQMQAALANLTNEQQARVQSEANRLQAAGMNQQEALRAALANQQAQLTTGQQNLQALLESQRMAEQSRQFGSELGLKGAQTAIGAGEGLAKIGATQQAAELDRLKFQESIGQLSQADQQRLYDLQYQDFLAQQQYPYEQIAFMSDVLRGSGNLAKNVGVYDAPASPLQQIVGPGLLGLGIYKEFIQ